MRKNAKGFNYYLIFIFWISNIFISSLFPVHKLWLLLMPLNFTYQRDPICFDVSYIPHISNRKKLCLVSSLNGDVNTLPMEQYFMHKISKCYDKSGSKIFGLGKYGPCKKLSCEIWWCNMLVLYHILSNHVISAQTFLLHLLSSNRCIVISHFEYYNVYMKWYVFSILKTKYIRFFWRI